MANSININIRGLYSFTIDIDTQNKYDKVYPLACSCAKLKLRRSYKAICRICSAITSTYNKNRIAVCPTCERLENKMKHKIWTTCYVCNQNDYQFEKTKKGFICQDCYSLEDDEIKREEIKNDLESHSIEPRFCPICEYEVFTNKKGIHLCDYCKAGNVRKSRVLRENKVLCCNCEQVAIQLNPKNQNVYCNECKYELFGSTYTFDSV